MSADVNGLCLQAGSLDTILKGGHRRTIQSKFGPNWLSSFKGQDFSTFFPQRPMLKLFWLMSAVLFGGWGRLIQF